jgi:poly-gamma-glutamate capsule biosynthesis protein CapA/YwtB (metallophosphatase superfamily)
VALTGNTYLAQRVSPLRNERFLRVVELLRSADVTLTNMECTIPDPEDAPAFVAGQGWAATHMAGTPQMIDELKFLGVDMVCVANNHVNDFGDAGVLSTIKHLRAAHMPFAGIGASLTEATQAGYVDSPSGLTVALIVACDWGPRRALGLNFPWPVGYMASDDAPPFRPRSGVNLLRYDAVAHVPSDQLQHLREISAGLAWDEDKVLRRNGFLRSLPFVGFNTNLDVEVDTDTELYFLGRKFVLDTEYRQSIVTCQDDLDRICTQIREARRQADIVCVALHDQGHGLVDAMGHIKEFGQLAIEAGADIYFCNAGDLNGIEFYKDKPMIYGVPTFFLQTEAVRHLPSSVMSRYNLSPDSTTADFVEARDQSKVRALAATKYNRWTERTSGSAVHLCVFDHHADLKEIRVQPIEQFGGGVMSVDDQVKVPRFRRGLPLMPEPDAPVSKRVLERFKEECRSYGTDVDVQEGVAIVRAK